VVPGKPGVVAARPVWSHLARLVAVRILAHHLVPATVQRYHAEPGVFKVIYFGKELAA